MPIKFDCVNKNTTSTYFEVLANKKKSVTFTHLMSGTRRKRDSMSATDSFDTPDKEY